MTWLVIDAVQSVAIGFLVGDWMLRRRWEVLRDKRTRAIARDEIAREGRTTAAAVKAMTSQQQGSSRSSMASEA